MKTLNLVPLWILLCVVPLSVNAWTYTFSTSPKAKLPDTAKAGDVYIMVDDHTVQKIDLKPGDTYVVTSDGKLEKVSHQEMKPGKVLQQDN